MDNISSYKQVLRTLIGKEVSGFVDRPLGSHHPKYPHIIYPVNYGYIEDIKAPDGMGQDVYILGIEKPLKEFKGVVIAIIEREDDNEDKLVVAPKGRSYTDEEIERLLSFQEQYFKHHIIR